MKFLDDLLYSLHLIKYLEVTPDVVREIGREIKDNKDRRRLEAEHRELKRIRDLEQNREVFKVKYLEGPDDTEWLLQEWHKILDETRRERF